MKNEDLWKHCTRLNREQRDELGVFTKKEMLDYCVLNRNLLANDVEKIMCNDPLFPVVTDPSVDSPDIPLSSQRGGKKSKNFFFRQDLDIYFGGSYGIIKSFLEKRSEEISYKKKRGRPKKEQ